MKLQFFTTKIDWIQTEVAVLVEIRSEKID